MSIAAKLKFVQHYIGPIALSLALVSVTTVVLFGFETKLSFRAVVFIYFFPTTFIAIHYGSIAAMVGIIASDLAAAYFFYVPKFSFEVSDPLDLVGMLFFTLLALMATQVVAGFANNPNVREGGRRARNRTL